MTKASARKILGVKRHADLRARFREIMLKIHPDLGGDAERARMMIEAYGVLKRR